ncbi:TPA: hypothetical protein DEG21_03795 [Patescibacteria group bacterium]|nr:hypothetical protein [Candidatus Gracilibacteria bacterium]HBY74973.1 hypothetical protein [Candidatus Gracilibacteria bacterium]
MKEKLKNISDTLEQTKNSNENESYKYFPTLISLQLQLNELKKSRSQIPILDESLDKNISEISSILDSEILNFRTKNE